MLERTKSFKIDGKAFSVNFPNVGQIIDMESLKQALTNNRYGAMASSGVASAYRALDIVDAVAFFQVCVPEVAKHYDIRNYADLAPEKVNQFVKVYSEELRPWYEGLMEELGKLAEKKDGE